MKRTRALTRHGAPHIDRFCSERLALVRSPPRSLVSPVKKSYNLIICSVGDMEIQLQNQSSEKKELATFRVSSHQLCASSPVFAAMLGPQSSFAEAVALRAKRETQKGSLYRLTLEDDDIRAMAIMLSVIHARSSSVPRKIDFMKLADMATICDKYDCASAIKPWDELWIKQARNDDNDDNDNVDIERIAQWLSISFVFRVPDMFAAVTRTCAQRAIIIDGELVVPRPHVVMDNSYEVSPAQRIGKSPCTNLEKRKPIELKLFVPDSVLGVVALFACACMVFANNRLEAIREKRADAIADMLCWCKTVYEAYDEPTDLIPYHYNMIYKSRATRPKSREFSFSRAMCCHSEPRSDQKSRAASDCDYLHFASLYKCFKSLDILDFDPTDSGADNLCPKSLVDYIRETPFPLDNNSGNFCSPRPILLRQLETHLKEILGLDLEKFGKNDARESEPLCDDLGDLMEDV